MASRLTSGRTLRAGTVSSLVQWYVSRGYSDAAINAAVLRKFGSRRVAQGKQEIEHWRNANKAGSKYGATKESDKVGGRSVPSKTGTRGVLRMRVEVQFDNPRTGKREKRGYTVDVEGDRSKRDIQRELRDKILSEEYSRYQERVKD